MTTGAERGEIAEVGSPIEVPLHPIDARTPLRWTTATIATTALLLISFNASSTTEWIAQLPQDSATVEVRPAMLEWESVTERLQGPRRWLADCWRSFRSLRFQNEHPGEQGADE